MYAAARDPGSVRLADERVVPIRLDITNPDDTTSVAAQCSDATLLINNAGVMRLSPSPAFDTSATIRSRPVAGRLTTEPTRR